MKIKRNKTIELIPYRSSSNLFRNIFVPSYTNSLLLNCRCISFMTLAFTSSYFCRMKRTEQDSTNLFIDRMVRSYLLPSFFTHSIPYYT